MTRSELITAIADVVYNFADEAPYELTPPVITFYPASCFEFETYVVRDSTND